MKLYGNDEINFVRNELYEISVINFVNESVLTAAISILGGCKTAWLWGGSRNDLACRAMSPHSQGTHWHLKDILRYNPDNWPAIYVNEEIFDTKLDEDGL